MCSSILFTLEIGCNKSHIFCDFFDFFKGFRFPFIGLFHMLFKEFESKKLASNLMLF